MRILTVLLLVISLLTACGGGAKPDSNLGIQSRLTPAVVEGTAAGTEVFLAALPQDGSFAAYRVPAVSSLSKPGSNFDEASANVSAGAGSADYNPAAGTSEYAIWRFEGTAQDSIGNVSVSIDSADPGASYWVAVADYSSSRWDWRGGVSDGSNFETDLAGSPGQHSSPAGYIYIAVLVDSEAGISVGSITLEYLERFNVSGIVLDMHDNPVEGALVTTNLLDPQSVFSSVDGSFSLSAIPNGNWAIMATLDGFQFFPAATMFTVDGADLSGLELRGNPQKSGFVGSDEFEPNDAFANEHDMGTSPLNGASISILDDESDFYSFIVPSEDWYYIRFDGDENILFPSLQLFNDRNSSTESSSSYVLYGTTVVGYYFPRAGKYHVEVNCEGGGGFYDLSLHSGRPELCEVDLYDSGDPGDGDDGLYEELYTSLVRLEYADFTTVMVTAGTGTISNKQVAPLPATVRPVSSVYTFSPESILHDFSSGPLVGQDFDMSATAPVDDMEPNDDSASATPLNLPLETPVSGWIGGYDLTGNDSYDYFSFDVQEGKHVMFRARFPENGPAEYPDAGYFDLYDSSEVNIGFDDMSGTHLEGRTNGPLSEGNYVLRLFMEGALMAYELEIYEYDPVRLSAYYELNGTPLDECVFHTQSADQEYTEHEYSDEGLAESNVDYMPGERIFVHHERFGMQFEPAYEWVEFGNSDIQLAPVISLAQDNHEPNDILEDASVQPFPVNVDATISSNSDGGDHYGFTLDDPGSLIFTIATNEQDIEFAVTLLSADPVQQLFQHTGTGNHSFYFRADNAGDYLIAIEVIGGEASYNLQVDKAGLDVYSISGTVDNGEPSELYSDSYLINHSTGEYKETYFADYLFGFYPNGVQEMQWQIANRNVTPSGKVPVAISGADVVLDFSAVYSDKDDLEPNDTSFTAASISLPATIFASLDNDNDYLPSGRDTKDYYEFVATSDGTLEASVKHQELNPSRYSLALSEGPSSIHLTEGKISVDGSSQLLRYPVVSGQTYFVQVSGNVDLRYQLDIVIIP
ncbi:MAG: carboxypeptidase regulatory-like domain-containing protein [Planctomycetales bacterium]|nr:carboxypeptidase regulatory-like domain-containing protein [bacterium]UNM09675.1 MAG: carboxypeptidase regulatory-like domain-containing protein [Planctomycetales bacterium]